jgi:nucleotide-binding universal stress UspA family protein
MSEKFLVAVDGSDQAWKAVDLATNLAKAVDAELLILHVVPYEPMPDALLQFAKIEGIPIEEERVRYHIGKAIGDKITGDVEAQVRKNGLTRVTTRVAEGNPADQIAALARDLDLDMVFVGSHGLSDAKGLLLGSVSHKVMNLISCTCVAVK